MFRKFKKHFVKKDEETHIKQIKPQYQKKVVT